MSANNKMMLKLLASMVIFGTIGIFRRYIPLSSGVIAMLRGFFGAVFLLLVMLASRRKLSFPSIKQNLLLLCLSGAAMGFNWILLFEAYNYTSVAVATLCYYMAPVFVILASPLIGERLTGRRLICVVLALAGMALVSGVFQGTAVAAGEIRGILLGLGAAVLYASVVLMNKRMKPMPAYDRTVVQLMSAAVVLFVYTCAAGELTGLSFAPVTVIMLAIVCIVHTGIAYALYFGSIEGLPAHILAIFSYIDPVVAVLLSALILHEKLTLMTGLGAVLIIGGALLSDLSDK